MELGLFLEFPVREGSTDNEAFKESFRLVDEAEELGVESVWLAEYHFNPARVLSSPITISSAIAGRTQRIRLGTAVLLLPLANPVRVAEEIATLDHISDGRVEFGIGRGTFPNVHEGFGVPFAESRGPFRGEHRDYPEGVDYRELFVRRRALHHQRAFGQPQALPDSPSAHQGGRYLCRELPHHRADGLRHPD